MSRSPKLLVFVVMDDDDDDSNDNDDDDSFAWVLTLSIIVYCSINS